MQWRRRRGTGRGDVRAAAARPTTPGIDTRVEVGEVAGKLAKGPARDVAADVAEVVDRWLDAAYVGGDYPRSDFGDAFPGFTKGAATLAVAAARPDEQQGGR